MSCGKKILITVVIILSGLLLAGCAGGAFGLGKEGGTAKENGAGNTEKSMGRYLETEVAVPEEVLAGGDFRLPVPHLQKGNDDTLILWEQVAGVYTSADKGETWEAKGNPWWDFVESVYIADLALSPDGEAALIYSPYPSEEEGADGEVVEEMSAEEILDTPYKYAYIDAAGTITELDFLQDEVWELIKFDFDRQGRLYGYGFDGVYRIDREAGTKKELFQMEGLIDSACFTEKYMIAFTTRGEVIVYDLEQDILAEEDKVLQDFIRENLGTSLGNLSRGHSVIAAPGEQENIIYFAFRGGLYRHVVGGTAIEQVIDGTLTSFGDPSMTLMDMALLPDNEFAVTYVGGKMYRYAYDPNVATVPDRKLKVYSLVENYSMQQAVSLFQKKNPDVYIRYEIGMSGGDSVTREDAIRNLNTKIMSGEGPDILLMDGLPLHSYEEKGILADVSALIDGMQGEDALFPNLVEASKKDGKLYTLPIRIQIPMMAGTSEDIQNIKDIRSLADTVERLREAYPDGAITGLRSEEQLLYVLGLTCSAAWTDEAGEIDEKALEEFLEAAKRIWQAEISGVDEEWLEEERHFSESFAGEGVYYATLSTKAISVAMEDQKLALGKIYRVDFDYAMVTSIAEITETFGFDTWEGQIKDGFIPSGMSGIAANAAENELAVEFYKFLFGKELQDTDLSDGLPVNMASFDSFAENPREGLAGEDERSSGSMMLMEDGGEMFILDVKWPLPEDFQKLKETVLSVSRVSAGDTVIEQAVLEVGVRVLKGGISPEEAVQEIVKRSAIYLAE